MSKPAYIILNGMLIQESEARISPLNRGLMYGDGCFETFRSYAGKFLGWELHFERLSDGLDYLEIQAPFSSTELKSQVLQVLEKNDLTEKEAMIRFQCWRVGERGYATSSRKMNWLIQSSEIQSKKTPLRLLLAKTRCIPSVALDRKYKLSNGLNYIKAAQEAMNAGCDDSLMLTINNKISETTVANLFWIKEGKIFTPSVKCDLLPGVTRELVIQVMNRADIELEVGEFEWSDLKQAETLFCTNSLIEILEVASISQLMGERGDSANEIINFNTDHSKLKKLKNAFQEFKIEEMST
ncbi:MAG: aminotransferase class IV [Gracilimonas sp.]